MAEGYDADEGSICGKYPSHSLDDDSSGCEGEAEVVKSFHRRISTSKSLKQQACLKEGFLTKQTSSFHQRWKRKYFKLKSRKLYYGKDAEAVIFDEVDLTDISIAECSTKNVNHSFHIISPFRSLVLASESRREMEDWMIAIKSVANRKFYEGSDQPEFSGQHHWYVTYHTGFQYCNVCRETLAGVTSSSALCCEVCKFKAHKKCAIRASSDCKWTTLTSIRQDVVEDADGFVVMPHQWLEGNLPVSAKCAVCDKNCGSVLRLQDWKCLWCRSTVHNACRLSYPIRCPLGISRVSIVPPTALQYTTHGEELWNVTRPPGCSPLLVFVNSKSGGGLGVKFLRRFKQLLNPAEVFDLMNGGPSLGLKLFRVFNPFRILVCGGDGSIGWVLAEIDKLKMHNQCQIGVLPLGTGNDLARVLGWGSVCDDDAQVSQLLEKYEKATIKMLDRWSIMIQERNMPGIEAKFSSHPDLDSISAYEESVVFHLTNLLQSDQHSVVISSAKVLCETVHDFLSKLVKAYNGDLNEDEDSIGKKCAAVNDKLSSLLQTLHEESSASSTPDSETTTSQEKYVDFGSDDYQSSSKDENEKSEKEKVFIQREALMSRANSLKKAVRKIIEYTAKASANSSRCSTPLSPIPQSPYEVSPLSLSPPSYSANAPSLLLSEADDYNYQDHNQEIVENACISEQTLHPSDASRGSPTATRRISSGSTMKTVGSPQANLSMSPITEKSQTPEPEAETFQLMHNKWNQNVFPIINPLVSLPMWPSVNKDNLIGKVLLANADALCAAASPLMDIEEMSLTGFTERTVMNSYFGIGLDAKITLDFHHKREEHPQKCRSRTKNLMWYGVLGGKELLQRSFKNLEQRVQLECDGKRIPLPSLQGIVFYAPSFADKIIEVVAVFGTVQMAASRVLNLQHHRIAQCRSVKITILGDEGVPVQVDGEAWVQPPGYICIVHKNRVQMLCRNRHLESSLKMWQDKQRSNIYTRSSPFTDDEIQVLKTFIETTALLADTDSDEISMSLKTRPFSLDMDGTTYFYFLMNEPLIIRRNSVEAEMQNESLQKQENRLIEDLANRKTMVMQYLLPLANETTSYLKRIYCDGHLLDKSNVRLLVTDFVNNVKGLQSGAMFFLQDHAAEASIHPDTLGGLSTSLSLLDLCLKKTYEVNNLIHFQVLYEDLQAKSLSRTVTSPMSSSISSSSSNVQNWNTEEVAHWLETINMEDYQDNFVKHDIRGSELLNLERRDLKKPGKNTISGALAWIITSELKLCSPSLIKAIVSAKITLCAIGVWTAALCHQRNVSNHGSSKWRANDQNSNIQQEILDIFCGGKLLFYTLWVQKNS
ncbi:Diacylglycerol kinase eta [Nymphon striatum]|nr:Diacylglycerol kinase eta [Nymphon striatum]